MTLAKALGLIAVGFAVAVTGARAQSTDGYHAIQVFPLVVDSASFVQRFHFRGAEPWEPFNVTPRYFPGKGTAQPSPMDCPSFTIPVQGEKQFASLRALCPGLPAGTAFGTLVLRAEVLDVFAAFSRVSNMAGAGFSAEAFPANAFTSANTAVTGLRRLSASGGAPAYQSNCFVGNLAELAPEGPLASTVVEVTLTSSTGTTLGHTSVDVLPGQLERLLDVFAAAGVPPGDHDDVVATFTTYTTQTQAMLSFCTVQDNTSYSADFRIAKQESAWGEITGAQDWTAMRALFATHEPAIDQSTGARLSIPPGATRNVHLVYFRHPDVVSCGLLGGDGLNFVGPGYGLELRLRVQDADGAWRVIAGGNNIAAFNSVYLGDKRRQGEGANTSYLLEVESNGVNEDVNRYYTLFCGSGSGSTRGELLRAGLPTAF